MSQNPLSSCAAGAAIKKAKSFMSCVHSPIIYVPDETLVLDVLQPMELHLLDSLIQIWPNVSDLLNLFHIQRQPFNGGKLAGNECRILLKNVDTLERLV